ncbi:hypothetical protein Patl1_27461 [Pistacia atlantica]|uniref:Uncharacterized protein n=1 Tax=Pistacia atlantica TaxID=434234 RepID=A0ACC1BDJ6_9ROSI|nr:hypothetical protein Patl1_27461 [Pistacia atlantica]
MCYGQKNPSFSPYGSYWRTVRKISTVELLSDSRISAFRTMRKQELDLLIEYIKQAAAARDAIDLSAKVSSLIAFMTCLMVFGKKYMDEEFGGGGFETVIKEASTLAAKPNLSDYIPHIASLDLQGLTKRMKAVSKVFDDFLENIIDEHVQCKDENRKKGLC